MQSHQPNTPIERDWTANIVITSGHAGLAPEFYELQCELYHVLARIDDPRAVVLYLRELRGASVDWLLKYQRLQAGK